MGDHKIVSGVTEEQVLSLEERRCRAMIDGDVRTLESLLSGRLWYSHTSGARDTRDSYLGKIRDGLIVYRDIRREVHAVEAWPGGVMVLAQVRVDGHVARTPVTLDSATLTVWRPEEGCWRLLAHHPTNLERRP
ncbi:nuclear transport factor 2 family protein [Rhodococcus aetherivorans]|uniref:nuclear transport factor 2 family protein n=1 Tax=Rhodococcus aetherivorans TaxID=191292 RepID=UPI0036C3E7A4